MDINLEPLPSEFIVDDDGESKLLNFNKDGSLRLIPTGMFKCLKCGAEVKFADREELEIGYCTACERTSRFKEVTPFPLPGEIFVQNPRPILLELDFNVFADMMSFVKDYLVYGNEGEYPIYCLGIISTWKPHWFASTPYFQFIGPIESGKTLALEIIKLLSYRGLLGPAVTPAALPRLIEKYRTNLLLDQAEIKLNNKTEMGQLLQAIFLSGYRRGQYYVTADPNDPSNVIIKDIYGFKALASERLFSTALTSRSVIFNMKEATPKKNLYEYTKQEFKYLTKEAFERIQNIRAQLLWYHFMVKRPNPVDNPLTGRIGEIFHPMITVASSLGLDTEEIVGFAKEKKKEFLEEMSGTETATILAYIQRKEYGIDEVKSVKLKEMATDLNLRTQYVGYALQNLSVKRKRSRDGMYIDMTEQKTLNHLSFLYKKFGISLPSTTETLDLARNERLDDGESITKPPLSSELQKIKDAIPENKEAGFKIDLEWLYNNFKNTTIDQAIQSGLLQKLPDGTYEWSG